MSAPILPGWKKGKDEEEDRVDWRGFQRLEEEEEEMEGRERVLVVIGWCSWDPRNTQGYKGDLSADFATRHQWNF